MEFLKKCTESVTETKHQAVYDILVFKYVNIFAGQPLRFKGATCERSSKNQILHIYTMFTSIVLNNTNFRQMVSAWL